mgnify:CR=1 FL=1
MKDQKSLLAKCLHNDIPAIVFQGSDSCVIEILQAAEKIYRKNGCSPEFLEDFHENVVENFRAYQQENKLGVKLPDLTSSEKEIFHIFQEKKLADFPSQIKDFEQHLKGYGFSQTHEKTVSHGKYVILNEKDWNGINGKNGDYDFAINYNKETKQISYFLFSNDPNYPERIGDYNSLKACFFDIMAKHPLQEEKNNLIPIIEEYRYTGYENIANAIERYSINIETTFISGETKYTIENIERELTNYAISELSKLDYVEIYATKNSKNHLGVISFNIKGVHPHDVASILDSCNVAIRSGNHCAQPLMRFLGIDSTCRASFYFYNTKEDVDKLVTALNKAYKMFEKFIIK